MSQLIRPARRHWPLLSIALLGVASSVPSGAATRPGVTTLVSVDSSGHAFKVAGGPPGQEPAVSADGRFVAFTGWGADPAAGAPGGTSNVWVHDRVSGTTTLVSVGAHGTQAVGVESGASSLSSFAPAISANGRYVAFESWATNLVDGDTNNGPDVFVRDLVRRTTTRVSVSSTGAQAIEPVAGSSPVFGTTPLAISDNGRVVAFGSAASNLVPGDTNGAFDVFAHDMRTGRTVRVSVAGDGTQADGGSSGPSVSPTGRFVTFTSVAPNLGVPSGSSLVFLRDMRARKTVLVSAPPQGGPLHSYAWLAPFARTTGPGRQISTDGRYVAFVSNADNLVPSDHDFAMHSMLGYGIDDGDDIFVLDRKTHRVDRASVTSAGAEAPYPPDGWDPSWSALSADGRIVAFESPALLVPDETEQASTTDSFTGLTHDAQVFVHDLLTGATELVSRGPSGKQAGGCSVHGQAVEPTVDGSGRYVAFASCATNLAAATAGDSGPLNAYVRDRGPALGSGTLAAGLSVAGVPSFAATGVVRVSVAATGSHGFAPAPDAALAGATLAYRPSLRDLLVRVDVRDMPAFARASPVMVYGMNLAVDGRRYQVRVGKIGPTATFGLFRRDRGAWLPVASLQGGYGTVGQAVTVAVPLRDLGVTRAGHITRAVAFSALGAYPTGPSQILDTCALTS